MSNPVVLSEEPLSMSSLKVEVAKIQKRDKELGYRTLRTQEYLDQFVHKNADKITEALRKLEIPRLKEEHIAKIADLLPVSVDDLKLILQGYTITVTKENMKAIVDEVAKIA